MFPWLESTFTGEEVTHVSLVFRLLLAALFGAVVAGIYIGTQRKHRAEIASLATTLVLLTILIAMVTLVIGNNVARAFSLVGALAIVRFRTVVEDTRDTAFVIFAVIVGMAVGAGHVWVPIIGVPIVALAALLANSFALLEVGGSASADYSLTIRLGIGRDPAVFVREIFDRHLTDVRLRSTVTGRQGAALDLSYLVRLRPGADEVALVTDLNRLEGMQSVELRRL